MGSVWASKPNMNPLWPNQGPLSRIIRGQARQIKPVDAQIGRLRKKRPMDEISLAAARPFVP